MSTIPRLQDRHVLLTGAGGGIGLAVAEACLAEGARCSVVDRGAAVPAEVAALQQRHPGRLAYVAADITEPGAIARLLAEAIAAFGPVHTLFNNAAVFDLAPLLDSDEASFDKLFAVNVKGMFFVMQAVLRHMVEAGTQGASVINMASQAGRRGEALVSHYCATKAAVKATRRARRSPWRRTASASTASRPAWWTRPCGRMWTAFSPRPRSAHRREEAPGGPGRAAGPHGRSARRGRRRRIPRQRRGPLHHRPDAQRRWRQRHELKAQR